MKPTSCVSLNACDNVNSRKTNTRLQLNAPGRRKSNKQNSKTPTNNKRTTCKEDAFVRVGCPYYKRDPNKYHERLACRGAGFKEIAKLRDHLKDVHNLSNYSNPSTSQLNFKQRKFLVLKTLEAKWKLAFHILFPEVPKDTIPSSINPSPINAADGLIIGEKDSRIDTGGEEYMRVEDVKARLYERVWNLFKNADTIHISEFMEAFGGLVEGAVRDVRAGVKNVQITGVGAVQDDLDVNDIYVDLDRDASDELMNSFEPHLNNNMGLDDVFGLPFFAQDGSDTVAGAVATHGLPIDLAYHGNNVAGYAEDQYHQIDFIHQAKYQIATDINMEDILDKRSALSQIQIDAKSNTAEIGCSDAMYEGSGLVSDSVWKSDGCKGATLCCQEDEEVMLEDWLVPKVLETERSQEAGCELALHAISFKQEEDWKAVLDNVSCNEEDDWSLGFGQ